MCISKIVPFFNWILGRLLLLFILRFRHPHRFALVFYYFLITLTYILNSISYLDHTWLVFLKKTFNRVEDSDFDISKMVIPSFRNALVHDEFA